MFLVDQIFTYLNAYNFKKLFPRKDYSMIEFNPIPRFFWNKFGLFRGGCFALAVQGLILFFILSRLNRDSMLVIMGFFMMVLIIHIDNFSILQNKKNKGHPRFPKWRTYALIILLLLSLADLGLTTFYLNTYHQWQPDRPFNEMESNPLLVFLINDLGLNLGLFFGAVIIWFLLFLVARKGSLFVCAAVGCALFFGSTINFIHIQTLFDLMKQYPRGFA